MKCFTVCGCVLFAASALVEAQLTVPQLGAARFSDGSVHSVRGVAANLIVDSRTIASADAASFSDSAGLTATNGLIRLVRADGRALGEYNSGEPQPVLNLDSVVQTAAVWLPSKHVLLRWDSSQFVETPIDDSTFGGRVTSVNLPAKNSAQFFVVRTDISVARITVSLPSGRVTSSDTEPGARGWAFVQQGWRLSQDEWGLIAERADGNRQTVQLSRQALAADDLTVERMSDHWLHVISRSTGISWAVYLNAAKLSVSLLPPPVVTEAAR
jgi:hypothetical protein